MPPRTQMIELNFSGSSVAIGAMTSASRISSMPRMVGEVLDGSDEDDRAEDDQGQGRDDLEVDDPQPRDRRIGAVRAPVDAVEAQRREVLGIHVGVGLEVALHVPRVHPEEREGHEPLELDRLDRQERGADGEGVGDREVAHVVGQDVGVDEHHVAGRAGAAHVQDGDAGHEHRQRREHERRAEDGPDADLGGVLAGREEDRDDRDHRLGQGRADRGEDRADGPLGEARACARTTRCRW